MGGRRGGATTAAFGCFTAVSAEAATGCSVTYAVTSQWSGGFGAGVTVHNLGDPGTSWTLTWSFPAGQTISQLWNGSFTQSASGVTVTNAAYNGAIASGGEVSFGFNGAWNGSNPAPRDFALNGHLCEGPAGPTPTDSANPSPSPSASASPSGSTSPSPSSSTGPGPPSSTYANPVLWEDLADGDVFRVGDTYYYMASTRRYSPGAPILRSYDLVHWEYAGHAMPSLDFDSNAYNLIGGRAYIKGIWASAINYRKSNGY